MQASGRFNCDGRGTLATEYEVEFAVHPSHDPSISNLASRLENGQRVTVLTGAGVSAASGIQTFRGPQGLWRTFRPEQLATPGAFARDAVLVWEWYDWRRQHVAASQPNRAHDILAHWSRIFDHFTLITQNVDGLHERAGTRGVIRFHGSIWELCCWNGCAGAPDRWRDDSTPLASLPPTCRSCGGIARPSVVWFGEPIDLDVLDQSLAATACDLFLTIGTSALVHPAASLVSAAEKQGAFTAEINLETTAASRAADLVLPGRAEELLDEIEVARSAS